MSVTARIKQKSILKKKLKIDEIINLTGLSYGVSDENFRLIRDEIASHTLLYDETKPARGIELWMDNNDILLSLSLPTSPSEIKMYYDTIAKICNTLKIKKYLRDDEQVNIEDNDKFIKYDEEASIGALEDIKNKTGNAYQRFEIFGIFNPISIGQIELKKINNNLNDFEKFLSEIQTYDVYYAAPEVFRKKATNKSIGIYSVPKNVPSVVPIKPYVVLNQIKDIDEWYVMFDKEKTIKYDDFIKSFKEKQYYYDANHVVVLLNDEEVETLVSKYFSEI